MTRFFPQFAVYDLRRVHFDVAVYLLHAAHIVLQRGVDFPAVRVPEDLARGLFLHVEQVHFAAQFTVIAFGRFLHHGFPCFQVFAVFERDAIDTLQHRARTVA